MGKKLTYKEAKEYTEKAVKLYTGEESLSSKRIDTGSRLWPSGKFNYDEEDVREAVARLEKTYRLHGFKTKEFFAIIDEIFGDQLCGSGDKLTLKESEGRGP